MSADGRDGSGGVRVPRAALEGSGALGELAEALARALDADLADGADAGELRVRWRCEGEHVELSVTPRERRSGSVRGSGRDLLVVEDDARTARAYVRLLSSYGRVAVARTVAEAREAWTSGAPWVGLIVDVQLPDGSGLDFVAEVRARDPHIPVLVLTGQVEPARTNRAQELEAEFAFKPVAPESLVAFVERAHARARVDDAAVAAVIARLARTHELTTRERDVLGLVLSARGSARAHASRELGLSPNTTKVHIGAILKKTGTPKIADLVQAILREAWLEQSQDDPGERAR